VKTGAFDFSGASRKRLFDSIDSALATVASNARDKAAGQHSFLEMLGGDAPVNGDKPSARPGVVAADLAEDFTQADRLVFEKELLGFYVSGHPMNVYDGLSDAIDTFSGEGMLQQARTARSFA